MSLEKEFKMRNFNAKLSLNNLRIKWAETRNSIKRCKEEYCPRSLSLTSKKLFLTKRSSFWRNLLKTISEKKRPKFRKCKNRNKSY